MLREDGAQQLERDLRQSIAGGELPPAGRLLSVRDLAAKYGLTYGRAHRVLKRLEQQGLLTTRHGGGTFVADVPAALNATAASHSSAPNATPSAVVAMPRQYWAQDETMWFREFIRGFESSLSARGERMMVAHTEDYLQQLDQWRGVRTHVLFFPLRDDMIARVRDASSSRTVMLVAHDPRHSEWALTVDIDGAAGIRRSVRACVERRHTSVALLSWEFSPAQSHLFWWVPGREEAYSQELNQRRGAARIVRVPIPDEGDTGGKMVEARLLELLASPIRPTALVCVNDLLAKQALDACEKLGLRVPQDLSIVGYDDEPWAVTRGLATFHRPYRELGQMAGEIAAQNRRQNRARWSGTLKLEPELVERTTLGVAAGG